MLGEITRKALASRTERRIAANSLLEVERALTVSRDPNAARVGPHVHQEGHRTHGEVAVDPIDDDLPASIHHLHQPSSQLPWSTRLPSDIFQRLCEYDHLALQVLYLVAHELVGARQLLGVPSEVFFFSFHLLKPPTYLGMWV